MSEATTMDLPRQMAGMRGEGAGQEHLHRGGGEGRGRTRQAVALVPQMAGK